MIKIALNIGSRMILKSIATYLFISILIAIILIYKNPSHGYELSIYSSIPVVAWAMLLASIAGGVGIVVNQVEDNDEKKGAAHLWQIGFLLILLSNLAILMLPQMTGYAFVASSDHLTHLGYVLDIMQTGHFSSRNVYPITHILISQIFFLTGISEVITTNLLGPLFYLIFILFTYQLSHEILPDTAAILATTASTILYCYYYNQVFPMGFAFITMILFLFLYFKFSKYKLAAFAIILIIVGLLIVFFHLVTSFITIIAILIMEFGKLLFNRMYVIRKQRTYQVNPVSLILPLLFFITLTTWIWDNRVVWNSYIGSVISWFHMELLTEPVSEKAIDAINILDLDVLTILKLFIISYGHYITYLSLSLIAIGTFARKKLISPSKDDHNIFLYSFLFLPLTMIWLMDYFIPLSTLSSGRALWYVTAMFPPLVGLGLYYIGWMEKKGFERNTFNGFLDKEKKARMIAVMLIMTACFIIGILSIHPSPTTLESNWAVSNAMVDGPKWLLERGNPDVYVLCLGSKPFYRFVDALWGFKERIILTNRPVDSRREAVYEHFGYNQNDTLGEAYPGDRYVILRENYVVIKYGKLYSQINKFNKDDFSKLMQDPTVNELYTNEDTQILYVL